MFEVPVDRRTQSLVERRACREAERISGAAGVDTATRLTVRLRRVPPDLAVEADGLDDELDELFDRQLLIGAEVHRVRSLVTLGREHDAFPRVVDVEELT